MAWTCAAEKHEMVKPNMYYASTPLDRPAKNAAERRSGRRWEAHCTACEDEAREPEGFAWADGLDLDHPHC